MPSPAVGSLPRTPVRWPRAARVVSLRQTPHAAFADVATPADAISAAVLAMGAAPPRFDPARAMAGPGSGWVMTAFLAGGAARFNGPAAGACYAADTEVTAIAETAFHYARILTDARETRRTLFGARVLTLDVAAGACTELRGAAGTADLLDPDPARYGPAQAWAAAERAGGADGVVYPSVRRAAAGRAGECVALFQPNAVRACVPGDALAYEWDGRAFTAVHTLAGRYSVPLP